MPLVKPIVRSIVRPIVSSVLGESDYTASAVTFDGTNDYLTLANLAGMSDTGVGTFVFWINRLSNGFCVPGEGGANQRPNMQFRGNNRIFFNGLAAVGGTNLVEVETANTYTTASGWLCFMVSWDLSSGETNLFVNDVSDKVVNVAPIAGVIGYTNGVWAISSNANGLGTGLCHAHYSDFYANTDEYIDFSVEANRRLFIDADGKPVFLGNDGSAPTGNQPAIFLSGTSKTFNLNKGYAADFTVVGALEDSPTSPSD